MWILPAQLTRSNGSLATVETISDLNEQSQICASSLLVRSKRSPSRTWSQKWKRDSWTRHLSGRIAKPSPQNHSLVESIFSLLPTRANHSAPQENDKAHTTNDTSGPTSSDGYVQLDLFSSSSKTSKGTFRWDSPQSSAIWKKQVTERRGDYSMRRRKVRPTSAPGSSSWPTAKARDWKDTMGCSLDATNPDGSHRNRRDRLMGAIAAEQHGPPAPANWSTPESHPRTHYPRNVGAGTYRGKEPLANQVILGQVAPANPSTHGSRQELWPQVRASDWKDGRRGNDPRHGRMLPEEAKRWSTPTATDASAMSPELRPSRIATGRTTDYLARQVQWATPKASDPQHSGPNMRDSAGNYALPAQAVRENWATPQSHDAQGPKTPEQIAAMRAKGYGVKNLNEQVSWGTPTARDHKSGRGNNEREFKELTPMVERTQTGKLNPRWVETLMGLPVGWVMPSCASPVTIAPTNSGCSATASCPPAQKPRSELCSPNS